MTSMIVVYGSKIKDSVCSPLASCRKVLKKFYIFNFPAIIFSGLLLQDRGVSRKVAMKGLGDNAGRRIRKVFPESEPSGKKTRIRTLFRNFVVVAWIC